MHESATHVIKLPLPPLIYTFFGFDALTLNSRMMSPLLKPPPVSKVKAFSQCSENEWILLSFVMLPVMQP